MRDDYIRCPGPIDLSEQLSVEQRRDLVAARIGGTREQAADLLAAIGLDSQDLEGGEDTPQR